MGKVSGVHELGGREASKDPYFRSMFTPHIATKRFEFENQWLREAQCQDAFVKAREARVGWDFNRDWRFVVLIFSDGGRVWLRVFADVLSVLKGV
ncbi:conserved hypothetical protein [Ricinus communis]|uniref:Uncharacterized protein n=1 Tax=Ricinus communis TaxID=3988 RepID=B9S0P7_RICCO|nr:conserved hypothetical protein [Ricinus communis]